MNFISLARAKGQARHRRKVQTSGNTLAELLKKHETYHVACFMSVIYSYCSFVMESIRGGKNTFRTYGCRTRMIVPVHLRG